MKKFFLGILFVLLLSGCSSKITEDKLDSITNNMSQEEVEEILGKPNETSTNTQQMYNRLSKQYASFSSTHDDQDKNSDEYNRLDIYLENLDTLVNACYNNQKVEEFTYKYIDEDGEDSSTTIYFIDDKSFDLYTGLSR